MDTANGGIASQKQIVITMKISTEFSEGVFTLTSYHITETDEETQVEEDAEEAPPELEEGVKSTDSQFGDRR